MNRALGWVFAYRVLPQLLSVPHPECGSAADARQSFSELLVDFEILETLRVFK